MGTKRYLVIGVVAAALLMVSSAAAARPGLAFRDNFNDGDAAGWTETTMSCSGWSVVDGVYTTPASCWAAQSFQGVGDPTWSDYRYMGQFLRGAANEATLIFRTQNAGNGHMNSGQYYQISNSWDGVWWYRIDNTQVSYANCTYQPPTQYDWHDFRIDVQASLARYLVDGVELCTIDLTVLGPVFAWGGIGLKVAHSGGAQYDSIRVVSLEHP